MFIIKASQSRENPTMISLHLNLNDNVAKLSQSDAPQITDNPAVEIASNSMLKFLKSHLIYQMHNSLKTFVDSPY